jgi:hypothetical protein
MKFSVVSRTWHNSEALLNVTLKSTAVLVNIKTKYEAKTLLTMTHLHYLSYNLMRISALLKALTFSIQHNIT